MDGSRILLVEDDPGITAGLSGALGHEGYAVDAVGTGGEAVRWVETVAPDLVVLDLGLPALDGIGVCRQLLSLRPTLRIVVVTARPKELDVVVGLGSGAIVAQWSTWRGMRRINVATIVRERSL